jgi:hypothetical protein
MLYIELINRAIEHTNKFNKYTNRQKTYNKEYFLKI